MQANAAEKTENVDTDGIVWDGERIPMDRWGRDHFSVLIYIESRNVDGDGQPLMAHMRHKPGAPRRGKDGRVPPPPAPTHTRLRDGTKLHNHDDWDCVDDLVHAKLVIWEGTGTYPILRLTSDGWTLASAARRHLAETKANGTRTYKGFDPSQHVVPVPSQEVIDRSQTALLGGTFEEDELMETVEAMRRLCEDFYWACFKANMGSRCHPFLEFNGIMSKYVNLCRKAAEKGIAFPAANTHTGVELPMADHDVEYFAEKFACIFGPYFRSHPEKADLLCDLLLEKGHG